MNVNRANRFHAPRQLGDWPTNKHVYDCTLAMQPIRESQALNLIPAPLFADHQETATLD